MLHMDEKFGPIIKQKMSFPTTELQIKNCTNLPHKDLTYQPFPQQIVFFRMMTTDKLTKITKHSLTVQQHASITTTSFIITGFLKFASFTSLRHRSTSATHAKTTGHNN